jgi:hypothetical protein
MNTINLDNDTKTAIKKCFLELNELGEMWADTHIQWIVDRPKYLSLFFFDYRISSSCRNNLKAAIIK